MAESHHTPHESRTTFRVPRAPLALTLAICAIVAGCSSSSGTSSTTTTASSSGSTSSSTARAGTTIAASAGTPKPNGTQAPSGPATAAKTVTTGQQLGPGTYKTSNFMPGMTFTIPDGTWYVEADDAAQGFALSSTSKCGADCVEVSWSGLQEAKIIDDPFLEGPVLLDPAQLAPHLQPLPDDLLGWLASHPYVHITNQQPVTIDGVTGTEWDELDSAPPEGTRPCQAYGANGRPCAFLAALAPSIAASPMIVTYDGSALHGYLLTLPGGRVTMTIGADKGPEFDRLSPAAQQIVSSTRFP